MLGHIPSYPLAALFIGASFIGKSSPIPDSQRFGSAVEINVPDIAEYERIHLEVWPDVLATPKRVNVQNYSIFRYGLLLFSYMEYTGKNYEADMASMGADPTTQDWIVGDAMAPIRRNFSMEDLRTATVGMEIERTVLVQTVTDYAETPELLALANSDPMIAGVVGWLDIDSPSAIDHLDSYLNLPGAQYLVGIRDIAQGHADPQYLARSNVLMNVKSLGEKGLTYDLLTKTRELPAAIELVKNAPEVQFVMDHISKPFIEKGEIEPWKMLMESLANFPNVVCKISGMVTEANWDNWKTEDFGPYVDLLFEEFGANRLMFGSD